MKRVYVITFLFLLWPPLANSQTPSTAQEDRVVGEIVQRENDLARTMSQYTPIVETYVQLMRPDSDLGFVPKDDRYFLGKLQLRNSVGTKSYLPKKSWPKRAVSELADIFDPDFSPNGFAQTILLDPANFSRDHYRFEFLRREFLGEVRCMVFDVRPKPGSGSGRFTGKIWVEDEGNRIVRFSGNYVDPPFWKQYAHFDSWRVEVQPNQWLPAYTYSEESDRRYGLVGRKLRFKAQTRLWGYDLKRAGGRQEFTDIQVEPSSPALDKSAQSARVSSPVQGMRDWRRQAEDNVLSRLEETGFLTPPGEVDQVICTVANNLQATNNLNIDPELRCRLLATTPLEAFVVGHTVILSRGLIDVLPDEASLAMVLASQLGHVLLGHTVDTMYAFGDRMQFDSLEILNHLRLGRNKDEVAEADKKAVALLQNSPYKDKISNAGLFLSILERRSGELPHLIRANLGDSLAERGTVLRMSGLINQAPQLQMNRLDQVASLPLGSRVYIDPWSVQAELLKTKAVPLFLPREKMPFEIAPVTLYLKRQRDSSAPNPSNE